MTLFHSLVDYKLILVTGPQRAGTRICARMIEHDTKHQYVDEHDFFYQSVSHFNNLINKTNKPMVIHCPAMCHKIHEYSNDHTMIVMVVRDISQIVASQERIKWNDRKELVKYNREKGVIISEVKYAHWLSRQRRLISNYLEVYYCDLKSHELWIDKQHRLDFTKHQWRVGGNG
jgi:hypothetical protein